ncbi:hypothetical protein T06_12044, partial [Trichinella sp. T6]
MLKSHCTRFQTTSITTQMDRVISLKPVSGQHGTRRLRRGKSPLTGRRAGGGAGDGRAEKKPCLSSHCWDPSKAAGPWYRNRERK